MGFVKVSVLVPRCFLPALSHQLARSCESPGFWHAAAILNCLLIDRANGSWLLAPGTGGLWAGSGARGSAKGKGGVKSNPQIFQNFSVFEGAQSNILHFLRNTLF